MVYTKGAGYIMSNYKKSAKDLAFDKERAKYNKQIRELESKIREQDEIITTQKEEIIANSDEIWQLRDWVARLLEYTELSEEDMKKIISREKEVNEISDHMNDLSLMLSTFFKNSMF